MRDAFWSETNSCLRSLRYEGGYQGLVVCSRANPCVSSYQTSTVDEMPHANLLMLDFRLPSLFSDENLERLRTIGIVGPDESWNVYKKRKGADVPPFMKDEEAVEPDTLQEVPEADYSPAAEPLAHEHPADSTRVGEAQSPACGSVDPHPLRRAARRSSRSHGDGLSRAARADPYDDSAGDCECLDGVHDERAAAEPGGRVFVDRFVEGGGEAAVGIDGDDDPHGVFAATRAHCFCGGHKLAARTAGYLSDLQVGYVFSHAGKWVQSNRANAVHAGECSHHSGE